MIWEKANSELLLCLHHDTVSGTVNGMHADILRKMDSVQFREIRVQTSTLESKLNSPQHGDVPVQSCMALVASEGSQGKYTDYFCKSRSVGDKRKRKKIRICFLFLFLPRKETKRSCPARTFCAWKFISLKAIGWGPPACMASKDMVQDKNISYVFV